MPWVGCRRAPPPTHARRPRSRPQFGSEVTTLAGEICGYYRVSCPASMLAGAADAEAWSGPAPLQKLLPPRQPGRMPLV